MNSIKKRRLECLLDSHRGLRVGDCVPFYFCPRSVMLHVIHQANHSELAYGGGQGPIVHLEADLHRTVSWAGESGRRWAFTLQNAGTSYFEDRSRLAQLEGIDWEAVRATDWRRCKEGKQAEFLMEGQFPWELVPRIGVLSRKVCRQAKAAQDVAVHKASVEIMRRWYYRRGMESDHDRIQVRGPLH